MSKTLLIFHLLFLGQARSMRWTAMLSPNEVWCRQAVERRDHGQNTVITNATRAHLHTDLPVTNSKCSMVALK